MRPLVENDACHGKAASIEESSNILKLRPKCYPSKMCIWKVLPRESSTGRVHILFPPLHLTTGQST